MRAEIVGLVAHRNELDCELSAREFRMQDLVLGDTRETCGGDDRFLVAAAA